jgi:hypothetical protein
MNKPRYVTVNYSKNVKKGKPRHGATIKKNCGHALSEEVLDAIAQLPQIKTREWSKSYLAEQIWRNYLGLPSKFNKADLEQIAQGRILV